MSNEVFLGSVYGVIELRDQMKKGVASAEQTLESLGEKVDQKLNKIGGAFKDIGGIMTAAFTVPIVAGLGLATKSALSFEDQMANIRKTVGITGPDAQQRLDAIGQSILELGRNTRTSVSELQDIATIGGQLGIGEKDIISFTDAVNKLNVALGDEFAGGAEQITKEMGTLRELFKDIKSDDVSDDLLRIGSAVNELGAAGLATGPVVTDFATRIVGLTGGLGAGAGDILGLSAALQELGVTAERGGSNVGRIFQEISKDSDKFAKALGLNAAEFKNLVNSDINEAFLTIAQRAREAGESNTEFAALLDEIGLDAAGMSEVLQKVGGSIDLVREKQDLANTSLGSTDSILDEYNIKNQTTQAELDKLGNNFNELAVTIGSAVLPIINDLVQQLIPAIQKVAEWFGNLDPNVQKVIIVFGLLLAAIGPVVGAIGFVISTVGTLIGAFTTIASTVGTVISAIGGIVAAFNPLSIVIGIIVAALAGLGIAAVSAADKFGLLQEIAGYVEVFLSRLKATWETIQKAFESPEVQAALERLREAFEKIRNAFEPLIKKISEILNKLFGVSLGADQAGESFISLETAISVITGIIDGFTSAVEFVVPIVEGLVNVITGILDVLDQVATGVAQFVTSIPQRFEDLKNKVGEIIDGVIEFIKSLPQRAAEFIKNFVEGIAFQIGFLSVAIPAKIEEFVNKVVELIKSLPDRIAKFIEQLRDTIIQKVDEVRTEAPKKIEEFINNAVQFFKDLPGKIIDGIGNLAKDLKEKFEKAFEDVKKGIEDWIKNAYDWGKNLIQSFIKGIEDFVNGIVGAFSKGQEAANQYIEGHSPPNKGPWKHIDKFGYNIGKAWADGIAEGMHQLVVPDFATTLDTAPLNVNYSGVQGVGSTVTNNVNLSVPVNGYIGTPLQIREVAKTIMGALEDEAFQRGTNLNFLGQ